MCSRRADLSMSADRLSPEEWCSSFPAIPVSERCPATCSWHSLGNKEKSQMRPRVPPNHVTLPLRGIFLLLMSAVFLPSPSLSQTNNGAGEFVVNPPTLVSLGFEWRIAGDDNRNAHVDVTFRKKGEQQWRKGLPLLRLQHEVVSGGTPREGSGHYFSYVAPNMFAGSLLNLEPDTEYECHFVLSDPDGVKGKAERPVTVRN